MSHPPAWSLVVCGGGSGGHLFPAIAVIEELQRREQSPARILFLSAQRNIDSRILTGYQVEQIALPAVDSHSFRRHPIKASRELFQATRQAVRLLRTLPAPLVLGTGGYSSVPGVLAGRWLRRPIVLMEQNVIPGRATSLLARFADQVCLSFIETRRFLPEQIRTVVTGNPVRSAIASMPARSVAAKKRFLVLGGSQGATAINDAMLRFAEQNRSQLVGWTILHQTGESDAARVKAAYKAMKQKAKVAPFFDNMEEIYGQVSFVVTRAGGTSLAEITCAGLPMVIIPYPKSLRNHQLINARHFVGRKCAVLVEQGKPGQFDLELGQAINSLLLDKVTRKAMSRTVRGVAEPEAAQRACEVIQQTLPQE